MEKMDAKLTLALIERNVSEILPFFYDDTTEDIMVNPDGQLWINSSDKGMYNTNIIIDPKKREDFVKIIASSCGTLANVENPVLTCTLPIWGCRFEGHIPPVVNEAGFAIRVGTKVEFSLDDYVKSDILSEYHCQVIRDAIKARKNILIVGGTGSGKTTLTNALLKEFKNSSDRFVILQDSDELQCPAQNKYEMFSTDTVTIDDLVASTLRLFPKRIVVGEIRRPPAAYDFLNSAMSGHPGSMTTMHADSVLDALLRLQLLLETLLKAPQGFIARAVDLIVFIERNGLKRKVSQVAMCSGHELDANGNSNFILHYYKEKKDDV